MRRTGAAPCCCGRSATPDFLVQSPCCSSTPRTPSRPWYQRRPSRRWGGWTNSTLLVRYCQNFLWSLQRGSWEILSSESYIQCHEKCSLGNTRSYFCNQWNLAILKENTVHAKLKLTKKLEWILNSHNNIPHSNKMLQIAGNSGRTTRNCVKLTKFLKVDHYLSNPKLVLMNFPF